MPGDTDHNIMMKEEEKEEEDESVQVVSSLSI